MIESQPTMGLPEHYARIIPHLRELPQKFTPGDLGPVTECIWDGIRVDGVELGLTAKGIVEFVAAPPSTRSIERDPKDWTPDAMRITTERGFDLEAEQGIVGLWRLQAHLNGPGEVLSQCRMSRWTALKHNTEPCLWVAFANIDIENSPCFLKDSKGNLQLKGFEGFGTTGHWMFRGKYTTLLIKLVNDWVVCVDTGSQEPPGDDFRPDLRMIGYLQGHPFNISVFHRISSDGQITGHAHSKSGHVGETSPLSGSPVPFLDPLFRVDFFDLAMAKLKADPEILRLFMIPTGQHFLAHSQTFESNFSHGWIALESLVNYGIVHGLIPKDMPKLADRAGWSGWVAEHSDEIKKFAMPGNEESFINTVRTFSTEQSKVRGAFKSLGLPWTPQMDVLGKLRGQYIHEGTSRDYDPQTTHNQIALLRLMLSALYARILGYEGPISDEFGIRAPSWWEAKVTKPTAELVVLEAPPLPG